MDQGTDQKKLVDIVQSKKSMVCVVPKKEYVIIGPNADAIAIYRKMVKKINHQTPLSTVDKFVLLALLQMNLAPHITGPYSRLQLFHTKNMKSEYFNFATDYQKAIPPYQQNYLDGLNFILDKANSLYTLQQLARLLDRHFPDFVQVDRTLENFIHDHQRSLSQSKTLKKLYFKGGHPLRAGETLPRLNYKKIISLYQANTQTRKRLSPDNHLFTYTPSHSPISTLNARKIKCSSDLNLYQHKIYPIAQRPIQGNGFGIINSQGEGILAVATQNLKDLSSYHDTLLLINKKKPLPTAPSVFCGLSDPGGNKYHSVISTNERDPGQPLYQLITQWEIGGDLARPMEQLLANPRQLYLENPPRLLFETARSEKKEIEQLLKQHRPLLHTRSIGTIWMTTSAHASPPAALIDPRRKEYIKCQ